MNTKFEIAGGSVPGREHLVAGRNNQDAFAWAADAGGLVAVVCDGCGSTPHSEVGAQLGARLVAQAGLRWLRAGRAVAEVLEQARQDVLARLRLLAAAMSADAPPLSAPGPAAVTGFARTVADHFLFTVVGVLVTAGAVTTFSLGDGLVIVNGERRRLGPFPNNEPPYLAYALLPGATGTLDARRFQVHRTLDADDVQSLVLATDGALDLDAAGERPVHGMPEAAARFSDFWTDDRIFRNPDMVRRRLAVLNRGPRGGLLPDDTTLVVVRRKPGEGRGGADG